MAYQLGSDGSGGDLLSRPACGSRIPPSTKALEQGLHYLTMDGRAVFKWAVRILADSSLAVLAHADCQCAISAGSFPTRPTCGSFMPPATCSVSTAMLSSKTWNDLATLRLARSRSRWMS